MHISWSLTHITALVLQQLLPWRTFYFFLSFFFFFLRKCGQGQKQKVCARLHKSNYEQRAWTSLLLDNLYVQKHVWAFETSLSPTPTNLFRPSTSSCVTSAWCYAETLYTKEFNRRVYYFIVSWLKEKKLFLLFCCCRQSLLWAKANRQIHVVEANVYVQTQFNGLHLHRI